MLCYIVRSLPILSVALLATASPLEPLEAREPAIGLVEDLLKGVLTPVGQLIGDVLSGAKSGIDNTIESKPLLCLNACCKC